MYIYHHVVVCCDMQHFQNYFSNNVFFACKDIFFLVVFFYGDNPANLTIPLSGISKGRCFMAKPETKKPETSKTETKTETKEKETKTMTKLEEKKFEVKAKETKELYEKSLRKLTNGKTQKDIDSYKALPEHIVIDLAKHLCMVELDALKIKTQKDNEAIKTRKALEGFALPKLETLLKNEGVYDLLKASLVNNPAKVYVHSIPTRHGVIKVGLSTFQDVEKPETKTLTQAQAKVNNMVETIVDSFGIEKIEKMLIRDSGTKKSFSGNLFAKPKAEKVSTTKTMSETEKSSVRFQNLPIHLNDIAVNMTLDYEKYEIKLDD